MLSLSIWGGTFWVRGSGCIPSFMELWIMFEWAHVRKHQGNLLRIDYERLGASMTFLTRDRHCVVNTNIAMSTAECICCAPPPPLTGTFISTLFVSTTLYEHSPEFISKKWLLCFHWTTLSYVLQKDPALWQWTVYIQPSLIQYSSMRFQCPLAVETYFLLLHYLITFLKEDVIPV